MKKLLWMGIVLTITLTATAFGQQGADTQFWHVTTVEKPIANDGKTSIVFTGGFRVQNDLEDLRDVRFGAGIKHKLSKHWSIKPSYLYRRTRRLGPDINESRIILDVVGTKKFSKVSYDNRNRIENRFRDLGISDATYYRNRSRLKVPLKKDGKTVVTPYIADDIAFNLREGNVLRNDLTAGFERSISKTTKLNFFYNYRRQFQSGTKHTHAFGVSVGIKLD